MEKLKSFFQNRVVRRILIYLGLLTAVFALECFGFNFRAFPSRGEISEYSYSQVTALNLQDQEEETEEGKRIYEIPYNAMPIFRVEFEEPLAVNSVYLDLDFLSPDIWRYEVHVTGYYVENGEGVLEETAKNLTVVPGDELTKYQVISWDHEVSRVSFTFKSIANLSQTKGLQMALGGVSINRRIPFRLSWFRILLLVSFSAVVSFFVELFLRRKKKPEAKLKELILDIIVYSLPVILMIAIYAFFGNFTHPFAFREGGTQISKELVDAFLHGHVYLDAEPSPALLALENPYDPQARMGIEYLWDHLLFEGKYYSYYGITPVFLLFLPFRLITGQYLYDAYGVLLFSVIGMVFLSLAFQNLLKLGFKDKPIPLFLKYLLYGLLVFGSGALFSLERPYFYEVSTSCAFLCMMIALFHMSKAGLIYEREEGKLFFYHLSFSSFWIALAVLSRATMALYAICHVIYLLYYFLHHRKGKPKKWMVFYACFSLIPYLVFGSLQMVYNYLRFHSVFDFGIEYSLTIADFKNMGFEIDNLWTSFLSFLLGFPVFHEEAFFVRGGNTHIGQDFYFFETSSNVGLFFRMPILLSIFVLPFLLKASKKERFWHILLRWLPCFVVPLIQVGITWQSGFATRYFTDFAWPMVLFAVLLILRAYQEIPNEKFRMGASAVLFVSLLYSSLISLDLIMVYVPMLTHYYGKPVYEYTRFYYHLAHELMFWR